MSSTPTPERDWADLAIQLRENVRGPVHTDFPLGPLSTYRVGGPARLFVEPVNQDDLATVASVVRRQDIPLLVVGMGSNLLVASNGFPGLAIHLGEAFSQIDVVSEPSADPVVLRVGAAAALPCVARHTVGLGLTGFEWAVGVPGSIGGAVRMNAGGHGSDMAASLLSAKVLDLRTADFTTWESKRLDFGYRESAIAPHQCVVAAELRLERGDRESGNETLREIVRWRREHQPGGHNAGSVFTNPAADSAGHLIDISGCKGLRVGSAEVSAKHANFIQVDDGGNADDVAELMDLIRNRVADFSGVLLHAETHMVGFDAAEMKPNSHAPGEMK